jgi:hypothetical protein
MKTNRKFDSQKTNEPNQANLLLILFTIVFLALLNGLFAQSLVKKDTNGFYTAIFRPDTTIGYSATNEYFIDSKGTKYTVYRTKAGKYFVLRTSKKTGKQYKEYLKLIN